MRDHDKPAPPASGGHSRARGHGEAPRVESFRSPVAVIGAGMSGLVCARLLQERGARVSVFEKSRGMGGRLSTRRTDHGSFDHGAQYFTAREPRFMAQVRAWESLGVVAPWEGSFVSLDDGVVTEGSQEVRRWVGVPGMNALGKHLASDLDIQTEARVKLLHRGTHGWTLTLAHGGEAGPFSTVVLALPAPQAAPLLRFQSSLAEIVGGVEMRPCWAVMATFPDPLDVGYSGAFVNDSALSWVARNRSKPERGDAETWVLHGAPSWSDAHLEADPQTVIRDLLATFNRVTGLTTAEPLHAVAHCWRYALPAEPLEAACLYDPAAGLGLCGDWCSGPRVEGAFLSGVALADSISAGA